MKQQKILQMTLRKHNNELQLVIQSIPFMDFALFKSVPCLFYSHKKLTTSIYGKRGKNEENFKFICLGTFKL